MVRFNLFDRLPALQGLVRDVLGEAAECPDVVTRCEREAVTDVGQVLKHDDVTDVLDGFCESPPLFHTNDLTL